MNANVDVLAVMERDAELALSWNGRAKEESQSAFRESEAAHRAVAELIEACESLQQHPDDLEIQADFCRALARVRGAQ